MIIYLMCFLLFLIGLFGIITRKNVLKMVVGLIIVEYAVNLFIVLVGYRKGGLAPILQAGQKIETMVDPLPQALVLTAIVISLAVLTLLVSICVRVYEKYNTLDITEIRNLKE